MEIESDLSGEEMRRAWKIIANGRVYTQGDGSRMSRAFLRGLRRRHQRARRFARIAQRFARRNPDWKSRMVTIEISAEELGE